MVELGELEAHQQQLAERHVRVMVISDDDLESARATQADFPHLVVVSDASRDMARAMDVVQPGAGKEGSDTNAPTTFLLDGRGQVLWLFRPDRYISRLAPDDLLRAIDRFR
jgi:peroxiredoxin